jgi:hypothetical protein
MSSLSVRFLSLIGAAVAAALPTHAEEYSWQLSGIARRAETRNLVRDGWAVDSTYYANPLDDDDGPFALAAFLNPTTRVSAEASKSDLETDRGFDVQDDPTAYRLSGAYVLPGQRWYAGASYAQSDTDDPAIFSRSDSTSYGVEAGLYLGANTTLELGLDRFQRRWETDPSCPPTLCLSPPQVVETTENSVGFEVFHLRRFRSLTYSLQGSVSESKPETDVRSSLTSLTLLSADGAPLRTYSVAGELFPTKALGVRLGYTKAESDGYEGHSYDVVGTWFFKPRLAIQLGLSRESLELGPDETKSAALRFIGRL